MSVRKEPSGRRSVQVEVEVPGTPEQVWAAIATGPGVSSWFVPTQIDGRVGGSMALDFGGGMVSGPTITAWQAPHRFTAEDKTWLQGGPPVATEWTVEAKSGGTCIVRVVHSLFASTDDWDGQLESTENGWPSFFRVLRYYLTHHRGERCATVQAMAMCKGTVDEVWTTLTKALGVPKPAAGQRTRIQAPGAQPIVATVEEVIPGASDRGLHLLASEPAPGIVLTGAFSCMGQLMANLQIYFYGARADAAARDKERVQQWFAALFPGEAAAS
jgi:uncharacterized protein YndB with AHSA1/START domain